MHEIANRLTLALLDVFRGSINSSKKCKKQGKDEESSFRKHFGVNEGATRVVTDGFHTCATVYDSVSGARTISKSADQDNNI